METTQTVIKGVLRTRLLLTAVLVASILPSLPPLRTAQAQDPNQVTGLTVIQYDGFSRLAWIPVDGATDYEIERTPLVAGTEDPSGPAVITGLWRPDRTVTPSSPTFADSGYAPGERFRWRVRARFGTTPQPFSDPVSGDTLPSFGPAEFLTEFETSQATAWTSYANEVEWTHRLDDATDRVRVVTIGNTVLGKEINLIIIGYPAPPATAAEISARPSVLANCNVHGNEPSGREACFLMARDLAFSNAPHVIDILSHATVLIVPAINGDGREANTRGNSTGQDLNRDHSLIRQPETFAFAEFLRDYTPDAAVDGHEFGDNNTGDLPLLWPRHLNVAQVVHDQAKSLVQGWMYDNAAVDGWWPVPYPVGLGEETILRNAMGLKNITGILLESRVSGGATRPAEGASNSQANRRRKVYSHLWTYRNLVDYHRANLASIQAARDAGIAFNISNSGRIVFRGSRDVEPTPGPGQNPPPVDAPGPEQILETPPCGYLMTDQQYTETRTDGATVEDRLAAHGIIVKPKPNGHWVPMNQPLRGLIPLLLDTQAAEELVGAQRVSAIGTFLDDFEPAAEPGWTVDTAVNQAPGSAPWALVTDPLAHSVTQSYNSDASGIDIKDDRLVSPPQQVSSTSRLSFWHRFSFEDGFDGGVLEVSVNGGPWQDILDAGGSFVSGGYNGTIDTDFASPIAGRAAWTGISASIPTMTQVEVNLAAFAGTTLKFRFRLALDNGFVTTGVGWWVDDVQVTSVSVNCPPVAIADSATTVNGIPVTIAVLANDIDPNNDTMTVTGITQPANGTAVLNPNQTVTYDPVCSFQGTDTFTYTISDGNGETDTGTVSVRARRTSRRGSFPC
jgi:Bacterial Ig domain/Zinc carboxypeptidase